MSEAGGRDLVAGGREVVRNFFVDGVDVVLLVGSGVQRRVGYNGASAHSTRTLTCGFSNEETVILLQMVAEMK